MMYLDWFVGTMEKTFNIEVKREAIGSEAHDFYHEETDDLLSQAEHLEKLPNPLLIEIISYVDDKGSLIDFHSILFSSCIKMI
ncbi:hypothetical protein ACIQZM_09360 [Peribacillus sp. NPDC097206]|uniref:hypothetical protein n=1 Tax=Peribacillus sp. NPDC097206 TaxID=3364398 RepID=UPI003807ABF7